MAAAENFGSEAFAVTQTLASLELLIQLGVSRATLKSVIRIGLDDTTMLVCLYYRTFQPFTNRLMESIDSFEFWKGDSYDFGRRP